MRLTLLGLLLAAPLLAAPPQSDRYKFGPLVSSCKLWNMVRYLHPRVTGDSTAWDAALVAAIPKIEAAHSDEELAVALDDMLKTLQDPCTRIAFGLPGAGVSVQSSGAGTMIIHAGNGDLSGSLGAGLMLKMGIPQTDNLVWDLRSSRMPFSLVSRPDIIQLRLGGIGYAFRQHSGYPPWEGTGLRYYSSSLQIVEPRLLSSSRSAPLRHVYLVDKDSAVPVFAILDQINGRTAIFSEDPPGDSQAGFTELVSLLGKVVAEVRVADLYYPDGTTEFAPKPSNRRSKPSGRQLGARPANGPTSNPTPPPSATCPMRTIPIPAGNCAFSPRSGFGASCITSIPGFRPWATSGTTC